MAGSRSRIASLSVALADAVIVERHDRALVLTLNRPQARNAIDLAMAQALAAALDELDRDEALRVGVLTGTPPCFSAGMDLKAFADGELPVVEGRGFAGVTERGSRRPLIAAVEGFAFGGGFEVVLACDLVVAARDARFALPEVTRGLFAFGGGLVRLPRRIPETVAAEIAFTGEPIGAERLHELGLVNRLAEPGGALALALELAAVIARNSPLGVRTSKDVLARQRTWSDADAVREQAVLRDAILAAPDAQEGAKAFADKRAPRWQTS
jgi:enoyl-CoA hydratase